ncbi:hypothetical protein [Planomicrobium sp. YIM 101495]|uniref:hypothetical protein n=1 Tax=Planomicrobium sp. YIM 101495 TaxID=2665160 RepID=UPI00351A806B
MNSSQISFLPSSWASYSSSTGALTGIHGSAGYSSGSLYSSYSASSGPLSARRSSTKAGATT